MRDIQNTKPLPARPLQGEPPPGSIKPTPARQLGAAEGRDAVAPEPPASQSPSTQQDITEATLDADGTRWTVRVLGRSGRAGDRSPPLLLLGFWPDGVGRDGKGTEHAREATVVARTLAELGPSRLEDALARSNSPPQGERRKPFFDAAGQARRGGAQNRRDS